jgi:hypothetical protein
MRRIAFITFLGLSIFAAGGFVGYVIGRPKSLSEDRQTFLVHEAFDRQARAYLRALKALDSSSSEAIADLRRQGLSTLAIYVSEVRGLRSQGHDWSPIDGGFYDEATSYLDQHSKMEKK